MPVVEVEHLTKRYGELTAVDDVSFSLEQGEVFALLGPNGAGKTTTVEVLEGARRRTSGTVRVLGHDPADGTRELRERTGVVLQEAGFEEEFTVAELVRLHGRMYPRRLEVDDVVAQVGLEPPSCSSSTSPPPGSTPRRAAGPGTSWRGCGAPAPPCC